MILDEVAYDGTWPLSVFLPEEEEEKDICTRVWDLTTDNRIFLSHVILTITEHLEDEERKKSFNLSKKERIRSSNLSRSVTFNFFFSLSHFIL
jgi:hypothetical protein